jgi:hypothetical protein
MHLTWDKHVLVERRHMLLSSAQAQGLQGINMT